MSDAIDVAAAGGGRAGRGGVTTEETMLEFEYAQVAQGKILDKYGTLYGISKDLVDRIGKVRPPRRSSRPTPRTRTGSSRSSEADMRQTEPEAYSDLDDRDHHRHGRNKLRELSAQ